MSTNPASPVTRRPWHHHVMAIAAAPLAHAHHRRYAGKPHHLIIDTFFNLVMWSLAVAVVVISTTVVVTTPPTVAWDIPTLQSGRVAKLTLSTSAPDVGGVKQVTIEPVWPRSWTDAATVRDTVTQIARGQQHASSFAVRPIGTPDDTMLIAARLTWTSGWWRQSTLVVHQVRIDSSTIDLEFRGPAQITRGATAEVTMVVKPTTSDTTQPAQLDLVLPPDAVLVSSTPPVGTNGWSIPATTSPVTISATVRSTAAAGSISRLMATVSDLSPSGPVLQVSRVLDVLVAASSAANVIEQPSAGVPTFTAAVRYHGDQGLQFGYGPLPPQVGQETAWRLFLYVRPGTTTNAGAVVTMKLPSRVRYVGHPSLTGGASLTYDLATRMVTWTIGSLPAQAGPMVGSFDVAVRPTNDERGQALILAQAGQLRYRTTDGAAHIVTTPTLRSTDVDGGQAAKGRVR